ncbi:MAG: hypothetical protein IJA89_03415 [Clostridia bacterium]|nr:hypothetical protein [Clostridia bacterium]
MKFGKAFLAGCLAVSAVAYTGIAVASAETSTPVSETTSVNVAYEPEIFVDWGDYAADNVPNAVCDKAYRVFDATAEDVYGEKIDVQTKVWLHYTESTKSLITVKDHTVMPTLYGIYTVEYVARDYYGNVKIYTYDFVCEESQPFALTISSVEENTFVGYETQIATASFVNANGFVTERVTASLDGSDISYDITGETSFVPMYAGTYTVTYEYSDYNETATKSYQLNVEKHNDPVFFENAPLNKYYIVGKTYELPTVKAYQFDTGAPVAVTPEISVAVNTGKAKKIGTDRVFTPTKAGKLTVSYVVRYDGNERVQTYEVQAIDVGYEDENAFDISKYFYSDDANISIRSNEIMVTTEREGAKVDFVNALAAHKIEFDFAIAQGGNHFDKMDIWLTDSVDPSVALQISYIRSGAKESLLSVNGSRGAKTGTNFYNTSTLGFIYSEKTMTAALGKASVKIATTVNGEEFSGFPSGKVNLSFSVSQVSGRSTLYIYRLNNQAFYNQPSDSIGPEIYFYSYAGGECLVGDMITVDRCWAGDVLDTDFKIEYAIKAPDGSYVIDENGLLLSEDNAKYDTAYTFRIRQQGSYTVQMTAMDGAGNKTFYSYAITVIDGVSPKVALKTEMPEEIKVGDIITVSDLTIIDDVSKECSVFAFLYTPRLHGEEVKIGDTFSPSYAGEYAIAYMVTDGAGNVTMLYHYFKVV